MLIAIDHGNKLVKIPNHTPFTSGIQESDTPPYGGETLKYKGKYYTLSDKRIPYHRDKTEDDRFFILTLFAIAYEIQAKDEYSPNVMRVQLAVGLPPAHYGAQQKAFTSYFSERGVVQFKFQNRAYSIYIDKVLCFPQAYAAAVTILQSLRDKPKAIIIDQGGMTTDLMLLKDGVGDLSVCESLEHGVITMYNQVKSKVSAELDVLLEESEIDAVLMGRKDHVSAQVAAMVERQAQAFVNDLFSTLRERGLELKSGVVVFVGGGAILLRRQIEASGKVGTPLFVEDIRANAKGFELLYRLTAEGR
ncbi:MAG: ParM/StbA family protein [Oscillospiraceae bacterium]|nr:ParM/StbA family protein [Oscillospiraceae bacterium]